MEKDILSIYNEMTKQASAQAEEDNLIKEQLSTLYKFAEAAEDALIAERGEGNYTVEDVLEMSSELINKTASAEEEMTQDEAIAEKIAELDASGRIMARAFIDERNRAE